MRPVDPQVRYVQFGQLMQSMPDLAREGAYTAEELQWFARFHALVATTNIADAGQIQSLMDFMMRYQSRSARDKYVHKLVGILHRHLAAAELQAPASAHGAFIQAGNAFDAMTAVGKVLGSATRDLLIVDPYMDEKILTDFAALAAENVSLRLLTDQQSFKATLKPATHRWAQQYIGSRPLAVRLSLPRSLHDRLIVVDATEAWVLTQSFNAFAARSPASIVKSDAETASLKISYYESVWAGAGAL
jgi:hypothetical protein